MDDIRRFAIVQTTVEALFDRDSRRCEPQWAVVTIPAGTLATVWGVSMVVEGGAYLVFEGYDGGFLYRSGEFVRPIIAEQG